VLCLLAGPALAVDLAGRETSRKTHERNVPTAGDSRLHGRNDAEKPQPGGDKAAITLHQVYAMYFGTLCDNDGYVVLDHNDTIVEDPNLLVYGGTPFSAEITITGDPFTTMRISVASASSDGLSLSNFTSNYGTLPLIGVTFDGTGQLTLHLGAQLNLAVSAQPGVNQSIGYTITATYE
jgi:hypothetical protein